MSSNQILTDEQRVKLVEALVNAPDEVLLDAVRDMKQRRLHIQDSFKEIQGFVGMRGVELPSARYAASSTTSTEPTPPQKVTVADEAAPKNTKPPGVPPSKIGGETKEKILTRCMRPSTAEDVNKFLGRGAGKLEETKGLLHLLWDRGEIVYDGSTYRRKT